MTSDVPHAHARIPGGQHPRRDVRVVIEPADNDLVVRPPVRSQGPAEGERQRRHVRAEGDRLRIVRADQVRDRLPPRLQRRVCFAAGVERCPTVRVVVGQIVGDGIDDRLRHLAAGRSIEVGDRVAVVCPRQGGEGGSQLVDGKGRTHLGSAFRSRADDRLSALRAR